MTQKYYTTLNSIKDYFNYGVSIGIKSSALEERIGCALDEYPSEVEYVDSDILIKLIRAIVELGGDPLCGMRHALAIRADSFDVLGFMALSCKNLEETIEKIIQYERVIGNLGYTHIVDVNANYLMGWQCQLTDPLVRRNVSESVLTSWTLYARQLVKIDSVALEVWFEHPAPEDSTLLAEYQEIFKCPVHFEQPYTGILLSQEQLQMPFPQANLSFLETLERHAQEKMQESPQEEMVISTTEQVLRLMKFMQKRQVKITKARIAELSGISERTLQRRLEEENTQYSALLDRVRKENALHLLLNTTEDIAEIAEKLGFLEQSSFSKAIKRWTGKTAREIREQGC